MTPKRKQRLILVGLMVFGCAAAVTLAVTAFRQNLEHFHSPADVAAGAVQPGTRFRLGGMVVDGSVVRSTDSVNVQFDLTDNANVVTVQFDNILPDLFREGQGIVAKGQLNDKGEFVASEVLAKHDENYMPPEIAEALEKAGRMPSTAATFGSKTLVDP